jgi:hypothetical protein
MTVCDCNPAERTGGGHDPSCPACQQPSTCVESAPGQWEERGRLDSMSREQAKRHFAARAKMLVHRIKALPRVEQIRCAADFLEQGQSQHAIAVLKYVVTMLEGKDGANDA